MRPAAPAPRGRHTRTRLLLPSAALVVFLGGCGGKDATAPEVNQQPEIGGLSVAKAGDVYLRGTVKAGVSDPEGDVTQVVIDWGDQSTVSVTSGFGSISKSHDYKTAGSYTVTVTAMDAAGNQVTGKGTLKLDEVPHACADIKVVGACFQVHPDYKGVDIDIEVFGNAIHKYSLSTTKNSAQVYLPIGGIWAQAKVVLTANFSRSKGKSYTRVQIYGCTLIAICTDALGDKKFTW